MSRVIFPAGNQGEAKSYVKALTGLKKVIIPSKPKPEELGEVLRAKSKYVSVDSSASIGFSFGSAGGGLSTKVLLVDYWYDKEVLVDEEKINSWTFAAGYRVGLKITGFNLKTDLSLGALAAKAQSEGLNVQIEVIRAGMPKGPSIPAGLANASTFDVEKFGELRAWEGQIIKYAENNSKEFKPLVVSASINIDGERLLNNSPAVRYSLWRIYKDKMNLKESLALLKAGKTPGIEQGQVRAVYSALFNDPTMIIENHPSENREPTKIEINESREWLMGYKNV